MEQVKATGAKLCIKCKCVKSASGFHKNRLTLDGLYSYCKECTREVAREYRKKNPTYFADYNRRRYRDDPEFREQVKEGGRQGRKKHPQKIRARNLLNRAVNSGRVHRPLCCSRCGGDSRRIEAHHHDYTKPLDVTWFCSACHKKEHIKLNQLKQNN
jgi:hypothetical protein